jgi:hypothetical protein
VFTIEAMKSLTHTTSLQDEFDALLSFGLAGLGLVLVCGSTFLLAFLLYRREQNDERYENTRRIRRSF